MARNDVPQGYKEHTDDKISRMHGLGYEDIDGHGTITAIRRGVSRGKAYIEIEGFGSAYTDIAKGLEEIGATLGTNFSEVYPNIVGHHQMTVGRLGTADMSTVANALHEKGWLNDNLRNFIVEQEKVPQGLAHSIASLGHLLEQRPDLYRVKPLSSKSSENQKTQNDIRNLGSYLRGNAGKIADAFLGKTPPLSPDSSVADVAELLSLHMMRYREQNASRPYISVELVEDAERRRSQSSVRQGRYDELLGQFSARMQQVASR